MFGDSSSVLGLVLCAVSLGWLLNFHSEVRPLRLGNWIFVVLWLVMILISLCTGIIPLIRLRSLGMWERSGAAARICLAGLIAVLFFLLTDVGVLVAGHRYWMQKAFEASSPEEARVCLRMVFLSTQYGRDLAVKSLKELPEGSRRLELELALCEMAQWQECERVFENSSDSRGGKSEL